MIPNKRPASEYRVRTLDRNDLNEKGKIYIGKGGTTTVDGVAGVSDITAKNIIDAINDNANGRDISAGSFTAASFKGNADSATNAENTDFTNAEWIVAPDGGVDCSNLVPGATYEVVMLSGIPTACIFPYFIGEDGKALNCGGILDIQDTETQSGPDAKLYLSSRTIFRVSTASDKLIIIKSVHTISDNSVTISAVYNFKYRRIR